MFDSLQKSLQHAFKALRGKARMTEANMRDGLKLVEQSLLEADVSYQVVQDFMARVTQKALGQDVLLALDPSQQVIGAVFQELVDLLGPVDTSLHLKQQGITTLMLCGLQGSGKTTTCAKLARLIAKAGKKPFLVAADLQRPAAIEQLHVLGQQLGVGVYSETGAQNPVAVCQNGVAEARRQGADVVILDTAGRLAIDQELMAQLQRIDNQVQPDQVYLVVDGMTGQDAVNSAGAFNQALELNGVIMTKLDGDARGGALLSVKHITGVPIKFIGVGETIDALEPFTPQGMASRILGQGDLLALVNKAQTEFDQEKMKEAQERLAAGQFTLTDFRGQLEQLAKPGLLQTLMSYMPGMGQLSEMFGAVDQESIKPIFGIIDAMTPAERRNPDIIDNSRRQRIARGAGVQTNAVNDLLKQFDFMASKMKALTGMGMTERLAAVQNMQRDALANPMGFMRKEKGDTGRRLSNAEKAENRKRRERELKKKKKEEKKKRMGG